MEFLLYCYYYVTWCDAWSDLSHENYLMCSTTAVVVFIKWEYINCGSAFLSWKSHKLKKNRSNRTLEWLFLSRIWHHTCCQCNISSMLLSTIIHVLLIIIHVKIHFRQADMQIFICRPLKQTIWWYNTLCWWTFFHFQYPFSLLTWNLPVSCDFSADLKLRILMDAWTYAWLQRSHISQYTKW